MSTPNKRHETNATHQTHEPHVARRAVRYQAAANAQAAMVRQFPAMFVTPLAHSAIAQTQKGDDDAAQTA